MWSPTPAAPPSTDVTVTDPMTGLSAIDCGAGSNVVATLVAGDGELHRRLHDHPPTSTAGSDHQHGHRRGHPRLASLNLTATSTVTIPLARHQHRQVGQHLQLLSAGYRRDLHLPGHQHRGRHPHRREVTDPMTGLSAIDCGAGSNVVATLAAGATATCTATYTTTAGRPGRGEITNTGTVRGHTAGRGACDRHLDGDDPARRHQHRQVGQHLSFTVAGTAATYTYVVTKNGGAPCSPT